MDLINVRAVERPIDEASLPAWQEGDAYVGGGTWLFSEPQLHARRLVDLSAIDWPSIVVGDDTVTIAANCTYETLVAHDWREFPAAALFRTAIRTLSASFKTYGLATVGGNIGLAFAKGMMTPVFITLDGTYELASPNGETRRVPASEFQTGVCETILKPGEYVRSITVPKSALARKCFLHRTSHSVTSHVTAMVIAATDPATGTRALTLSGALAYPVRITITPGASVAEGVDSACADHPLIADAHGSKCYRQALLQELAAMAVQSLDHES